MYQDKEQLYETANTLKQHLNEIQKENIKLKTHSSFLHV